MTYEQRKRTAIANVRAKLDEARESREWDRDEVARQAQADAAEVSQMDMNGPPVDGQEGSAGRQRALESARQWHQDRQDRWDAEDEEQSDDLSALCATTQPRRRQSSPAGELGFDDDGDFDE